MSNEELSDYLMEAVPEKTPLDYFDRFLDLGIYLNETLPDNSDKRDILENLRSLMTLSYETRN